MKIGVSIVVNKKEFQWPPETNNFRGADFRYFEFDSIYTAIDSSFDFYLADFRGSSIKNCTFCKDDFRRSDFVSCFIQDTTFDSCRHDYQEFSGCNFIGCVFKDSRGTAPAFTDCHFSHCNFDHTNFPASSFHSSTFENCVFTGVSVPRSSIEDNKFLHCEFINTKFNNGIVHHCIFDSCTFHNVTFFIDYLATYLGLTVENLSHVNIVGNVGRHSKKIQMKSISELLNTMYEEYFRKGKMLETVNVSLLQGSSANAERILMKLPDQLQNSSEFTTGKDWLRFSRAIAFWANTGDIDYYWLCWVCKEFANYLSMKKSAQKWEVRKFNDEYIFQSYANLVTDAQKYLDYIASQCFSNKYANILFDTETFELFSQAPNQQIILKIFDELISFCLARLPDSVANINSGIFNYKIVYSRKGSIILGIEMIVVGALLIRFLTHQASGIMKDIVDINMRAHQLFNPARKNIDDDRDILDATQDDGSVKDTKLAPPIRSQIIEDQSKVFFFKYVAQNIIIDPSIMINIRNNISHFNFAPAKKENGQKS